METPSFSSAEFPSGSFSFTSSFPEEIPKPRPRENPSDSIKEFSKDEMQKLADKGFSLKELYARGLYLEHKNNKLQKQLNERSLSEKSIAEAQKIKAEWDDTTRLTAQSKQNAEKHKKLFWFSAFLGGVTILSLSVWLILLVRKKKNLEKLIL